MSDNGLVEWLTGVLDDVEAGARKAAEDAPTPWRAEKGDTWARTLSWDVLDSRDDPLWITGCCELGAYAEIAAHIAAHDPAAVLADVAAKRAIAALHEPYMASFTASPRQRACCASCGSDPGEYWPCQTLRLLASAYRDRPGWLELWAPTQEDRG